MRLPPYEVPESDADLLSVGKVTTEERLQASGLIRCDECGEYRPPQFKRFCSLACEQQHERHLLEKAVREAPHTPCGLNASETIQLMFTLNNHLRAAGQGGRYVHIEPWDGFSVTVYDRSFVGATKAVLMADPDPPTEVIQAALDALLPDVTVPFEGRPMVCPIPLPPEATSEQKMELVYDMRVNRRQTFVEIGRTLNRSGQWARLLYGKAFRIGYSRALKKVRPVPSRS